MDTSPLDDRVKSLEEIQAYAKKRRSGLKDTTAFCVRCNGKVPFNSSKPYCDACHRAWATLSKPEYPESFCHVCGMRKDVTAGDPICQSCHKEFRSAPAF